jgi:DNA-binding response OmpR family regulator
VSVTSENGLVAAINTDTAFLRLLEAVLSDEGYTSLLLQAGDIAYDTVKQRLPAVVILDIDRDMPNISWRLVDLLALDPDTAKIPLIICSVADQMLLDRTSKLSSIGCMIIEKPFMVEELLAEVRALIGRRSPEADR